MCFCLFIDFSPDVVHPVKKRAAAFERLQEYGDNIPTPGTSKTMTMRITRTMAKQLQEEQCKVLYFNTTFILNK